jgi:opacity protein-like surface antigen
MKRLILLSALIVCFTGAASAQDMPRADVFAGYSYVRFNPGFGAPGINTNGGSASASFHLNSWLGLVADFGGYHADEGFGSGTAYTYLFGPRVYLGHGRLVPFVQNLYGGSHIGGAASECDTVRVHEIPDSCSASQNAFAMSLGGGIDWNATEHIGIRVIQAEYLLTRFFSDTQNNARISTGVVFRF